jgi:hypothetical protein
MRQARSLSFLRLADVRSSPIKLGANPNTSTTRGGGVAAGWRHATTEFAIEECGLRSESDLISVPVGASHFLEAIPARDSDPAPRDGAFGRDGRDP